MAAKKSPQSSSSTVSVKDVFKVGLSCAIAVLVISILVTRGWVDHHALGNSFIYAAVAFVVVSGLAFVLNLVMRGDSQNDDQSYPRMR